MKKVSKEVIRVEHLSKRYRLGLKEKQSETLIGQISQALRSPWNNLKRLRELNKFGQEDDSVFWALKDISFEVNEGEVLGIIGKNGAGKSTLLKILSQITEPTSGKIEIHGRVASLLEVGTGFHPELSGRENIYMNGTILGMTRKEIDSKLDEIIDFSGVEKFIDTPVKFYSSGMKVRLGFSVAAHLDPEILIIDEVLAVGDFEFQAKCLGKMESVSRDQGRTVIFVSHNLKAIKNICSRCISLEKGILKDNGDVNYILKNYLYSFNNYNVYAPDENDLAWVKSVFVSSFNSEEIISGCGLNIELIIAVETQLTHFVAAICIYGNEDEVITTSWQEPISVFKGQYKFVFQNDYLIFSEGDFYLSIGLTSKQDQIVYLDKAFRFNVIQNPDNGYSVFKTNKFGFLTDSFNKKYEKIY
jgi:lipopolysaccharide transport system ATP-binding protein